MQVRHWILPLVLIAWTIAPAWAQDHTYSSADIEAGVRLYGAQCALCHGPNGDMVSGVDLGAGGSAGPCPTRISRRVIASGVAGPACRRSSFSRRRSTALIAFIRAGFDPAAPPSGSATSSAGRRVFEAKGRCAPVTA